jgi:opacity protein-like surface antigen
MTGAVLAMAGAAAAQPAAAPSKGYAEAFAQAAFGNVTSQAYGGEVGVTVWNGVQVFVEAGQVRNVATESVSANAQLIAGALAQLQSAAVGYSVKQPVTFFGGGARYPIAIEGSKIHPYVQGGFGVARVKNDVSFTLGGADAASSLAQYVTLGDDLSGSVTKPMLSLGAGVMVPVWQQLVADLQFRYGRIFTEGEGINVTRLGLGFGFRF